MFPMGAEVQSIAKVSLMINLIAQLELNDLVRDLSLTKNKIELTASCLQQWKLLVLWYKDVFCIVDDMIYSPVCFRKMENFF